MTSSTRAFGTLGLAFLAALAHRALAGGHAEKGGPYAKSLETIEVAADEAAVTLGGTTLGTVKKGRRFGVTARAADALRIQFWGGRNLRIGWLNARDVRVLGDADVDLTAEALRLAAEFNPKLDVAAYKARADALATRVAQAAAGAQTARERAWRISLQLFRNEGFGYDVTPRTLDRVLEEKRGNCLGLSLLYLCAAEKLQMAFHMLPFPTHALIRYDDGREQFNVEPSFGGMVFVDDAYMRRRYGPPEGISWTVLSKPQTMAMLYSDVGSVLGAQKRLAEATSCFVRAIELNPNYGVAYYNWGGVLAAADQHALACERFSRATQLHPNFADAYNNWGSSLGKMGEFRWAAEKFALAAKLDPTMASAHFNWGMVLLNLGKRDDALARFARAVELQPSLKPAIDQALKER